MKKFLLVLVALFAIGMTAEAQGAFAQYGRELQRKRAEINAARHPQRSDAIVIGTINGITRYMSGWSVGVIEEKGTSAEIIGTVACGIDKNGKIWHVNHSPRRVVMRYRWHDHKVHAIAQAGEIEVTLDPGEYESPKNAVFKEYKQGVDTADRPYVVRILK